MVNPSTTKDLAIISEVGMRLNWVRLVGAVYSVHWMLCCPYTSEGMSFAFQYSGIQLRDYFFY